MLSTNPTSKRFATNSPRLPYQNRHLKVSVSQDPYHSYHLLRGHVPPELPRQSLPHQITSCVHLLWPMNSHIVCHHQRTILDNQARQLQPVTPHLPPQRISGHIAPPWSSP